MGFVDKIGTAFDAKEVATGFGVHLAIPMIREAREKGNLTRETARKVRSRARYLLPFVVSTKYYFLRNRCKYLQAFMSEIPSLP